MQILGYEELPQGGFAGLCERQFVTDSRVFGNKARVATEGIGHFVYLADANFQPKGETGMHPHREIDVISVMVSGRVAHAGSLEHGQALQAGMVQVQRAGAEGFSHNEVNPDEQINQMIQLWVLPDKPGEAAGYRVYTPAEGVRQRVYGGPEGDDEYLYSHTLIDVANLRAGQSLHQSGEVIAYLSKGAGLANGETIAARTLIRSVDLEFTAKDDVQLILVYTDQAP